MIRQLVSNSSQLVTHPHLRSKPVNERNGLITIVNLAERRIPLMDDASRNGVTSRRCPRCDAPADDGLIFCKNCGAALRPPLPLTQPVLQMEGSPSNTVGIGKQILIVVLKGIAGIAAVVAVFCPLGSLTQILLFAASVALALICYAALTNLDATHVEDYGGDGYWPKPLDWSPSSKADTSANDNTPRTKI